MAVYRRSLTNYSQPSWKNPMVQTIPCQYGFQTNEQGQTTDPCHHRSP